MSDIPFLRARLRKRDKDIQQAIKRLDLEEGEMADMIRDGFRLVLKEMGVLNSKVVITPNTAQLVARELMRNLKEN